MTLEARNSDLFVSHLHGNNGVTEKIKRAMYESAKQFVYIGFLLKEVRDYKYYEEGNYEIEELKSSCKDRNRINNRHDE